MTEDTSATMTVYEPILDRAFALAPLPMAIVDPAGTILKANARFQELFHCIFASEPSVNDSAAPPGNIKELIAPETWESIVSGNAEDGAHSIAWRDGNGDSCNWTVNVQPLDKTAVQPMLLSLLDRPGETSSALDAEAELERFYYLASHDLQEPLRKIVAFSQTLKRRLCDSLTDNDAVFELERLGDAARRMSQMLKALLDLSRLSHCPMQIAEHSLTELVEDSLEGWGIEKCTDKHSIAVTQEGRIRVDQPAMKSVFGNIIKNSLAYAAPGQHTRIDIQCVRLQSSSEISITDNGPGVAPAQLGEMFEPFSRYCAKTLPGNGMGLPMCRKIVARHGGRIHAELHHPAHSQALPGLRIVIRIPA